MYIKRSKDFRSFILFFASLIIFIFGLSLIQNINIFAYASTQNYTVEYNLNGVFVVDQENYFTATSGVDFSIVLSPDEESGFVEIDENSINITIGEEDYTNYTYNVVSGELIIYGDDIVGNILISAEGLVEETNYTVTVGGSNCTFSHPETVKKNSTEDLIITFTPKDDYILYPTLKTLLIGETDLLENLDAYAIDRENGTVLIKANYITGNVQVEWNAQKLELKTMFTNITLAEDRPVIEIGNSLSFTLVPDEYYLLPKSIYISYATSDGEYLDNSKYSYNSETGLVVIEDQYVTDVICVSATAQIKNANITYNVSGAVVQEYSALYKIDKTEYGKTWYVYLVPDENFRLDLSCIKIKAGDEFLSAEDYVLGAINDNGQHRLQIKKDVIFVDDVEIIVTAATSIVLIEYDLKNITISGEAETEWVYDKSGLSMTFVFNDAPGYEMPLNTSKENFKIFADGEELSSGWSLTQAYKLSINKATTKCEKLKIYAHAKPIDYTIKLNAGEFGSLSINSIQYNVETDTIPFETNQLIVDNGYEFVGWKVTEVTDFTNWSIGETAADDTFSMGKYGDITITAQYEIINYTITIESGEYCSCDLTPIIYNIQNSIIQLPDVEPEEKYSLICWQVTSVEGESNWQVGDEFEYSQGSYGNITIKPICSITKYTIILDPTFRGTITGQTVVEYDINATSCPTIEEPIPTGGYNFVCWKVTSVSDGATWVLNSTFDSSSWVLGSKGDITITAQYEAKNFIINFETQEHVSISFNQLSYTSDDEEISFPTIDLDLHYSFVGWQVTSVEGESNWQVGDIFEYSQGTYGNISIMAIVNPTQYKITLLDDDKAILEQEEYYYTYFDNESPTLNNPKVFSNFIEYYAFDFWQIVNSNGSWVEGEIYSWKTNSYGDVTLKAIYKSLKNVSYTIKHYFEDNNGNFVLNDEKTEIKEGKFWDTVTAEFKNVDGFSPKTDHPSTNKSAVLDNTNICLRLYYSIKTYTVSYSLGDYLQETAAVIKFKTYDPYKVKNGNDFYVKILFEEEASENYHISSNCIQVTIGGRNIPFTFSESNILFISQTDINGDILIEANVRGNIFTVEYVLDKLKIRPDIYNVYSQAVYGTRFGTFLDLDADEAYYEMPKEDNDDNPENDLIKVYVDNVRIYTGYNFVPDNGNLIIYQYAVLGNIKIEISAKEREYNITIKGETEDVVYNYTFNTNIVLQPIEKMGYKIVSFKLKPTQYNQSWQDKYPDGIITDFQIGSGLIGNVSLTPVYETINYTITLDAGDRGCLETFSVTYTIENIAEPEMPTPVSFSGYDFNCWEVTKATGNWELGLFIWSSGKYGDITLKAKYGLMLYGISYYAGSNGTIGSHTTDSYTIETIVSPTTPIVTPNAGYKFDKWLITETNGNWALDEFVWIPGKYGDLNVTAQYTPIEYTILYKVDNHGRLDNYSNTYTIETSTEPLKPDVDIDLGYHIEKWTITTASGSWVLNETFNWSSGKYGDIVVTANVVANKDTKYKVCHYFEGLDGKFVLNSIKTQVLEGETDTNVTAKPLHIAGFVYEVDNDSNISEGKITAEPMLELRCYYLREVYVINISVDNDEYGSVNKTKIENVKYGTPITILNNQVFFGENTIIATHTNWTETIVYNFENWVGLDEEFVSSDLNVVANFTMGTRYYAVIFKNGDKTLQTVYVEYGQVPVYSEENPTKENDETFSYIFEGWRLNEESKVLYELPEITEDTTFVASFKAKRLENNSTIIVLTIIAAGLVALSLISVSIRKNYKKKERISK